MATRRLLVEVIGDDASLQRALGRSGAAATGFGDKMAATGERISKVGKKLTTHLTLPIVVAGGAAFRMADAYTDATATVEQHIKTMGVEGVVSLKGLTDEQRKFSMQTGIAQTELVGAAGKLVTFANVAARGTKFINETTRAAADLSAAGFGSVDRASVMLGKALDNPIKGMTALTRVGVSFTAKQAETIKKLVETGHAAKAQGMILKAVQNQVGGTAKEIADPWDRAKASLQAAGITIGTVLMPVVAKVSEFVARLAARFQALSPGTQKAILVVAGLVAAIGPLVSVVGALTAALGFLIANQIVLLIAGVVAVAAAIAAAVIWPDKLKAALERMGLSAHAAGLIVDGLRAVFAVVKGDAMALASLLDTVWGLIKGTVQNALEVIRGIINVVGGLIHGDWARVWHGIKQIVGGTLKEIWLLLKSAVSLLGGVASAVGNAIWNGLKSGATAVINWIIGKLNWLIDKYNLVAGWLTGNIGAIGTIGGSKPPPGFGGLHGPEGRAMGGRVMANVPYMVGESGRELFVPRTAGTIVPNNQLRGGGAGGDTYHVQINVPHWIGSKRDLEDAIVTGLSQWARRNGNAQMRAALGVAT